jgi:hypothetical protein
VGIREKEEKLAELEMEDEIEAKRVSISQKKALEKEAKRRYGRDWKKVLGLVKSLKPDQEVIQTLYGVGVGLDNLREMNRPPRRLR